MSTIYGRPACRRRASRPRVRPRRRPAGGVVPRRGLSRPARRRRARKRRARGVDATRARRRRRAGRRGRSARRADRGPTTQHRATKRRCAVRRRPRCAGWRTGRVRGLCRGRSRRSTRTSPRSSSGSDGSAVLERLLARDPLFHDHDGAEPVGGRSLGATSAPSSACSAAALPPPEARGRQPADDLTAADRYRSSRTRTLVHLRRDVVVVALEPAGGNAEPFGERVQLV